MNADVPKVRWLGVKCPRCGRELNSWDEKVSRALGYLKYSVCEDCICKEYGSGKDELRLTMSRYFGVRPCFGI